MVWIPQQGGGARVRCRWMCGVCEKKFTKYQTLSVLRRHNFPSYKVRCLLTRRENQSPGAIGKKKVSPRNKSAVDRPTATETPSIFNINTAAASNVPRPPGIKLTVRTRFAIMKLANT